MRSRGVLCAVQYERSTVPYNLHLTAHCVDRALHVRGTNQNTTSSYIIIDHSIMGAPCQLSRAFTYPSLPASMM